MSDKKAFKVIIVGGGVGGLALAGCLQRANIDYVLLEAREMVDPQMGQSICILPSGFRILDQLGYYEELEAGTAMLKYSANRDVAGNLIQPKDKDVQLLKSRSGYGGCFGDRQFLLQILYKYIQDKSKVLTNKKLATIEDLPNGVKAFCTDGSVYEGDIVVGADGTFSKVRQEMWRLADAKDPGFISDKERNCMSAEYRCIYGKCDPIPGFSILGDFNVNYMKDRSIMSVGSPRDGFYIFASEKMDKTYRWPNIPRFTEQDAEAFGQKHADIAILPGLTFGEIWKRMTEHRLVALGEAEFKIWTYGRIACVGDSVHKFTPNAGHGGNSAIEDAAAITNALNALLAKTKGNPTKAEIEECLKRYQDSRLDRTGAMLETCNTLTRIHAMKHWIFYLYAYFIGPLRGDEFMDLQAEMVVGAEHLDFLPLPKRSLNGTMPFNPQQGAGRNERYFRRALLGLPFVGLWYLAAYHALDATPSFPLIGERLTAGTVEWTTGSVQLLNTFYHIKWLDTLWQPLVTFFTSALYGYDAEARWQLLSFCFDLGPFLAILYVESTRRSNASTFAQLPFITCMLGQFRGVGVLAPLYFYLLHISTPIEAFKATDMRLTNIAYTTSILPILLLTYYLPTAIQFFHPSLSARQSWNWLWQMWPVWVSVSAWAIKKTGLIKDTSSTDRLYKPRWDYKMIQYTVGSTVAISAITWWFVFALSPFSLTQLFVPTSLSPSTISLDVFAKDFLKRDEVLLFANVFLWLTYVFWDIKTARMVKTGWVTFLGAGVASLLLVGPGATLGLGWLWRERVITFERHWAAVTTTWEVEEDAKRDGAVAREDEDGDADVKVDGKIPDEKLTAQ